VAEIPPTSGVITTPDVLVVKLIPDPDSLIVILACLGVCAVILVFYILQQVVGVRSTGTITTCYGTTTTTTTTTTLFQDNLGIGGTRKVKPV